MSDAALEDACRALAERLGTECGEPVALSGGITNRNYRVRAGDEDLVLRLPGRDTELLGIDRHAEREANTAAAAAGIAPEVVAFLEPGSCLVTRFVAGTPPGEEDLRDPALLEQVVAALRAFHGGPPLRARFSPFALGPVYRAIAQERGLALPADVDAAAAVAAEIEPLVAGPEHEPVPCHNDLLASNLLVDGDRVRIIDWEYAGMGDRFFDLANLSVNNGFGPDDDARVLEAYFGEGGATPRRRARLALMRLMSDYREAMWGVVQAAVSDLDFDFLGYADQHFTRLRAAADGPQYAAWLRDAAAP
jgi:thiamine kinase-like enzyme